MPYIKNRYKAVIESTMNTIKSKIYTNISDLEITCYKTKEPVPYSKKTIGEKLDLKIGDKWGDLFDCAWFNFKGKIPENAKGEKIVLIIDISGEGLIFDNEGNPVRGITSIEQNFCGSLSFAGKRIYNYTEKSNGNETLDIWMDAGANCLFGTLKSNGTILQANIAKADMDMRSLFYDYQVLFDMLNALSPNSARYNKILFTLYESSLLFNEYSKTEVDSAKRMLEKELNKKGGDASLKFTAIGHAHIDLAWLWPIRETKRKGARTFATVLDLMDRYPDYKFGASQPQLYEWIKEEHPVLYKRIKEKVAQGRWEIQGCMWVEADTNVISGESLVRQVLYGKRFFAEEFGIDVKHLWLPDVFGYSGALPQILKKSGCDYFMTQKMSWNEHNKFPHQTFIWKGIDGSEVFSHMLPEETYNGAMHPASIKGAENNYIDSGNCDEALILFGIGDGGGGPGPEHLERANRMKNLEGLCPVEQGFAQPLFERLEKNSYHLKKWCGELYLEKHQGTYTTQAKNKMFNRKIEIALRELEFSLILLGEIEDYPKERIDKIWKEVLLYQFHDIIPGSSIKRVYDESLERYEVLLNEITDLTKKFYSKIAESSQITLFNSLSWERDVIVELDSNYYNSKIPAFGFTTDLEKITSYHVKATGTTIENSKLIVNFDSDGALISVYDKAAQREVLRGKSNVYNLYDDRLADCWDIGLEYLDKEPVPFQLNSQTFYTKGPYAICEQNYTLNQSSIKIQIILQQDSSRIDFNVEVYWQENLKMLRTAFITDIITDNAIFEIQYGKIKRANNDNTTWQNAQFEVCGHKWVDLSESDYGVALLNDCKYGYRVKENVIDVNLLRSQNFPGENADRGFQKFTYSLYPHIGNEVIANVSKEAYEFNIPFHLSKGIGTSNFTSSLFKISDGAIIEAVKKAEDSDDIIVRIYEPHGKSLNVNLCFRDDYKRVTECDLMENDIKVITHEDKHIKLSMKPFEITTLKFKKNIM